MTPYTICTLPNRYRPKRSVGNMIIIGSQSFTSAYINISAGGEVKLTPYADVLASAYIYVREIYFV